MPTASASRLIELLRNGNNLMVDTPTRELKLNKNWSTGFLFDYAPMVDEPKPEDTQLFTVRDLESQRI